MNAPSISKLQELSFSYSSNFPELLGQLNSSLLISTYQAGKLISVGVHDQQLSFNFHTFDQVMGIAVRPGRIAVGSRRRIDFLQNNAELARELKPERTFDSCWLSRSSLTTGSIHGHDLAWGTDGLWSVNTLFSCLCTLHEDYNFVPRWQPPFISQLLDQDRCHLNGLAMEHGVPRYVTVLGESDQPAGWRSNKASGGAIIDVPSGNTVLRGLCMPHSPRVYQNRLWVLNSGCGQLGTVDRDTGQYQVIAPLPGYARGLAFCGKYAFVGLSRIRETNIFGGLPLCEYHEQLKCGVGVVDITTGSTVATLQFQNGVEEVFAVEVLPGTINPKIVGPDLTSGEEGEIWVVPPIGTVPSAASSVLHSSAAANPLNAQSIPNQVSHDQALAAGEAAHKNGQLSEALEHLRIATQRNPNSAAAFCSLGSILQDVGREDEAVTAYERAIQINPNYFAAQQNLGVLCINHNQPYQALKHFELAQQSQPQLINYLLAAKTLPVIYDSLEQVQHWRSRLERCVDELVQQQITIDTAEISIPTNFYFAYQGLNDLAIMKQLAKVYRGRSLCDSFKESDRKPAGKRLKVGFMSAYFCKHTIGRLNIGMVEQLDRNQFDVTVIALRQHQDELAQRYRQAAQQYIEVPRSAATAAKMIAELGLDILIFADVGMDTLSQSLCYWRMAPVQAVTWGHPDTSGSPEIDYFISSDLCELPEAQEHYSEQLVRLPSMGLYYDQPKLTGPKVTRESLGLPRHGNLYLCPQSLFKIHPQMDQALVQILERDTHGHLVLIQGKRPEWTRALKSRWQAAMTPEAFQRVHFLPSLTSEQYLQLLSLGDVMLDPFPFGGGHTILESMAVGTPVVTYPSPFLRGRLAQGLLSQASVGQTVAHSVDQYVQIALRLAMEPNWRAENRQALSAGSQNAFNNSKSVLDYQQMMHTWCRR